MVFVALSDARHFFWEARLKTVCCIMFNAFVPLSPSVYNEFQTKMCAKYI